MPEKNWFRSDPALPSPSIDLIRLAVALVILMHPLHGFAHPADIPGFGTFLTSVGFPFGLALAWMVLVTQVACSLGLIVRRWVVPACMGHIVILSVGILVFHAPLGWFVVGPGEGGMEFSVLMISCLVAVLLAHWPRTR
jgi:putative oxidoreductase